MRTTAAPLKGIAPSEAWRQEVFNSKPRRDIQKQGKSTTRNPVIVEWAGKVEYVNGGHERIAALLLEQLWIDGYVRRWKPQPFDLHELGGPNVVPDFLAELDDRTLHVIEVKAKRFVNAEVEARFEISEKFLEPLGIFFHLWTNADKLGSATSHTVAELERGRRFAASPEVIAEIGEKAAACQLIGQLLNSYSWDDVLSAAAYRAFHIDITKPIHENTPLLRNHSGTYYSYLFARRNAPASWWDTLPPSKNR